MTSKFIDNGMRPTFTMLTALDLVPFGQTGQPRFFALRLSHPGWPDWRPGQFVMLRPESFGMELPWGRPFSICHMTGKHLICFFKVAGNGTRRMAEIRPGDRVAAWGPLGNYFATETGAPTLLLAGGMGIAPFVGYVNRHPKPWNMSMLFGHREPLGCYPVDSVNERIPVDTLREQDPDDLDNFIFSIQERMRDCAEQGGLVLACGPVPFLRVVRAFAHDFGARTQISLENRMACGVGACLGCVCKLSEAGEELPTGGALARVCVEGPVFEADQVEF